MDPIDQLNTITPAQPLVLEWRDSKGGVKRCSLIDANLGESGIIIGRSSECDIPYWWFTGLDVQLPKVSRRHAALRMVGNIVYTMDLQSKNGTFAAGRRLEKEAIVNEDGEMVDLGREFTFRIRKVMDPDLQCVVLQSVQPEASNATSVLILSGASLGKNTGCGIIVDDPTVSEKHAKVILRENSFWLKVNPGGGETSINNSCLKENGLARMKPSDIIKLGEMRITIRDYNPKGEAAMRQE
jgi:pSer/pThr/pTyr-binding forkhead associated (FHA) protein